MKDLSLRARVVIITSNMVISRPHLIDVVKEMNINACCTCSTTAFPHSANHVSDCKKKRAARAARLIFLIQPIKSQICGCRYHCRHRFLKLQNIFLTTVCVGWCKGQN